MSNSDDLSDLLKRAGQVASAAFSLANRFAEDAPINDPFGRTSPSAWVTQRLHVEALANSIASLRNAITQPPTGFEAVANALMQLKNVVQKIRQVMGTTTGRSFAEYSDFRVDLRTAAGDIFDATNQAELSMASVDSLEWDKPDESNSGALKDISQELEARSVDHAHEPSTTSEKISFELEAIATTVREFARLIRKYCPLKGGPKVETGTWSSYTRDCNAFGALAICWTKLQRLMNVDNPGRHFSSSDDDHILRLARNSEEAADLATIWMSLCRSEFQFGSHVSEPERRRCRPKCLPEIDPELLSNLENAATNLVVLSSAQNWKNEGDIKPLTELPITQQSRPLHPDTDDGVVDAEAAEQVTRTFEGGELVFFPDRVELCGIDICSGPRCQTKRRILDLLRNTKSDGSFVAYSGDQLANNAGLKGKDAVSGPIRSLRDAIIKLLKTEARIKCGREDVILSRGPGYRLSHRLSVHDVASLRSSEITDMADRSRVRNVRKKRVRNVRKKNVPNVPKLHVRKRREWILHELGNGLKLKAPSIAKHFNCDIKTAQRDLNALKKEEKIEFIGSKRTGYYRLRQGTKPS